MHHNLKISFSITVFLVVTFLLTACGSPPPLQISSVTHDPEVPSKGKEVAFTIAFRNASESSDYSDVTVKITDYSEFLDYRCANPQPEREDTDQHVITWALGNLSSNADGKVIAYFILKDDIPPDQFTLPIKVEISGKDSQGSESSHSDSGETFILENPTPTPSVFVYAAEGVTLEIPWQGNPVSVEQQDFYNDYAATSTPAPEETPSYEIIRPIIYLQVYKDDGSSEKVLLNSFSPPMQITVQYTLSDVDAAGGDPNNLTLAILNHDTGVWSLYSTTIDPSSKTGTISVSSWTSHLSWARPR